MDFGTLADTDSPRGARTMLNVSGHARFENSGNVFNGATNFQAENINIGRSESDKNQCLRDLYSAESDPLIVKERLARDVGLVEEPFSWIFETQSLKSWLQNDKHQILRITAGPGKGKTMTMIGLIDYLSQHNSTAVSFFLCQGTDDRLKDPNDILKALLYQILERNKEFIPYLSEVHSKRGVKIFEGSKAYFLLQDILIKILKSDSSREFYFVIDALDESKDCDTLVEFIEMTTSVSTKIKWLVSNRYDKEIDRFFQRMKGNGRNQLMINFEDSPSEVGKGIKAYISKKVDSLERNDIGLKSRERIKEVLLRKAQGTYLWISIACRALEDRLIDGIEALEDLPSGLIDLYDRIWERLHTKEDLGMVFYIIGIALTALRPLRLEEMISLLELDDANGGLNKWLTEIKSKGQSIKIYVQFSAFLNIQVVSDQSLHGSREISVESIHFIHHSAKEYLQNQKSAAVIKSTGTTSLHASPWVSHAELFRRCRPRSEGNFSLQGDPGLVVDKSSISYLDYAYCYWATHLERYLKERSDVSLESPVSYLTLNLQNKDISYNFDAVELFFKRDLLNWLVVLGVLGKLNEGVAQLRRLHSVFMTSSYSRLLEMTIDAQSFVSEFRGLIEEAPTQIYSAVLFSPERSILKSLYLPTLLPWVKTSPFVRRDWARSFFEFEVTLDDGSFDHPSVVELSSGAEFMAIGTSRGQLEIWDVFSGVQKLTTYLPWFMDFPGNLQCIDSIRFTTDGKKIMVTSQVGNLYEYGAAFYIFDMEALQWETASWRHLPNTKLLTLSPDGEYCVGIYGRNGVFFRTRWKSGQRPSIIQYSPVTELLDYNLIFSPDSTAFCTVSVEKIDVWRVRGDSVTHIFHRKRDSSTVDPLTVWTTVCFSHNSQLIAILENNKIVRVWDLRDQKCLWSEVLDGIAHKMCFSQDDTSLACLGSKQKTMILEVHPEGGDYGWRIKENGDYASFAEVLGGGLILVLSLAVYAEKFAENYHIMDVATIREKIALEPPETLKRDNSEPVSAVLSLKGGILALIFQRRIEVWRVPSHQTLDKPNPAGSFSSLSYLYSRGTAIVKALSTLILSFVAPSDMDYSSVSSIEVSPKGSKIATVSHDEICIWDSETRKLIRRIKRELDDSLSWGNLSTALSADCRSIIVFSYTRYPFISISIYDFAKALGLSIRKYKDDIFGPDSPFYDTTLSKKENPVTTISPDGSTVVVLGNQGLGYIILHTGIQRYFPVSTGNDWPRGPIDVAFSSDGQLVAATYETRVVLCSIATGMVTHIEYTMSPKAHPLSFCQNDGCLSVCWDTRVQVHRMGDDIGLTLMEGVNTRSKYKDSHLYFWNNWLWFGEHRIIRVPGKHWPKEYKVNDDGVVAVIRSDKSFYFFKLDLEVLAQELGMDWQPPGHGACRFCQ